MDGENNGNPIKMDDLGVPFFLETPIYVIYTPTTKIPPKYQFGQQIPQQPQPFFRPLTVFFDVSPLPFTDPKFRHLTRMPSGSKPQTEASWKFQA